MQFRFEKDYTIEIRSPKGALLGERDVKAGTVETLTERQAEAAEKAGVGTRQAGRGEQPEEPTKTSRRG